MSIDGQRELEIYTADALVMALRAGRSLYDSPPCYQIRDGSLVYFLACRDRLKVGFSRNPAARAKDMQGHCPYQLTIIGVLPGNSEDEQHILNVLRRYRVHGEWHSMNDELEKVINLHTFIYAGKRVSRRVLSPVQFVPTLSPSSAKVVAMKKA